MLLATVAGAVVTQPMYRFLASHREELDQFNGFAFIAATLAAAASLGTMIVLSAPLTLAIGLSVYSFGAVVSASISVQYQIDRLIGRLALYEALRILTILTAITLPVIAGQSLSIQHLVFGLALSNFLPFFLLAKPTKVSLPRQKWLIRTGVFGIKSSGWLLLAGLPIVGSKTILSETLTDEAFGNYSAITDASYRGFGLINSAVTMWAFPTLARLFDTKEYSKARSTLNFSILVYVVSGLLLTATGLIALLHFSTSPNQLPGGLLGTFFIVAACFTWQGMSIAHKPFELTLRTTRMVLLMAVGVSAFFAISVLGPAQHSLLIVTSSMTAVAVVYTVIAANQKLEV